MSIQSKLAHYYRFALIGATSSGKTCMLAKLASGRDSNTRFSSASIPLGDFAPNTSEGDDPSKWTEERRLQESFRIGEERIEAAVAKFTNHQRPDATSTDDTRPMMRFKLSDCNQRGDFYIWTEDYAGELLNKKGLEDETSLSTKLKNNLLQNDGLVIIVEAAETPKEMEKVRQQVETLKQFFSALTEEEKREGRQHNIPVAIVITKWDRISKEINFDNLNKERALLSDYFEKNKIYEQIITAAQSNAMDLQVEVNADCPTAIVRGNTAVFPVSAFGKSELDGEGNDFPLDSQSFCLVEPFYWLASRCDEIRISELEESVKAKKFFWPFGFSKIRRQVKVLKRFIQEKNPCKERFHNARVFLDKKMLFCILTWIFIGYCVWAGWNQYQFKSWETTMRQPENSAESFSRLENNFVNYKKSFYYAWLGHPGKKRTDTAIEFINDSIEKLYWHPVEELSQNDEMTILSLNYEMAKKYLELFPNGKHAKEAHKFVQAWEIYVINKASEKEWNDALAAYIRVLSGQDCQKIINELSKLYSTFGDKYEDRCKNQIEALPKSLLEKLDEKARAASKQDMITEYDNCNRSVKTLEDKLREQNKKALADCINGLVNTINKKKQETIKQLEQDLYADVCAKKTVEACDDYLNTMTMEGTRMKNYVTDYKKYLNDIKGKVDVEISVKVAWTHQVPDRRYREIIKIGGIEYTNKQFNSPPKDKEIVIGTNTFKGKSLSDQIDTEFFFRTENNFWHSEKNWLIQHDPYKISNLLGEKRIDITPNGIKYGTIKIKANIIAPKETELPPWKE